MTADQEEGQVIILLVIALILAQSLSWFVLYVMAYATDFLATHSMGMLISVALCFWLYCGSSIAKWIIIVIHGIPGACGLLSGMILVAFRDLVRHVSHSQRIPTELGQQLRDIPVIVALNVAAGVIGLTIACVLLTSSKANAFLAYQRRKRRKKQDWEDWS